MPPNRYLGPPMTLARNRQRQAGALMSGEIGAAASGQQAAIRVRRFSDSEADLAVSKRVEELQRAIAFRSWRMIGRAVAQRATSLKPACSNAEAVPVKMFDVLFGAVVSTG
jgi:hypothetical protein